jgi:hypothetical protein
VIRKGKLLMMKKIMKFWFIAVFVICSGSLLAQNDKTVRSHSIKGPLIGLSYSYEIPIALQSTLNFELMINGGFGSGMFRESYWLIAPVIRVEPRYYYNLTRRFEKEKKTLNNSANYLALAVDYQPGISIGKNATATRYLQIVPKYGLKRTIGRHFIFEFAAGLGAYVVESSDWDSVISLDLKLGYAF